MEFEKELAKTIEELCLEYGWSYEQAYVAAVKILEEKKNERN